MTGRRNPLTIPAAVRTTGEAIEARNILRDRARVARDEAALKASGKKPHTTDPDDPWAEIELRVCEPGCEQHGGTER